MKLYELAKVRTNNFNDAQLAEKIQKTWEMARQQLVEGTTVYGVYHDFASDYRGDYTLSIATATLKAPDVIEVKESEHYQVFQVDTSQELAVFKAWQTIWKLEETGQLKRVYHRDYEKYSPDGTVAIYIEPRLT